MTPEKALDLVTRYSELTREIKACTAGIKYRLSECPLQSQTTVDGKDGHHLFKWYAPQITEGNQYDEPVYIYTEPTLEVHGAECEHCFRAHNYIQNRKTFRRQLASVKGAMTKATP